MVLPGAGRVISCTVSVIRTVPGVPRPLSRVLPVFSDRRIQNEKTVSRRDRDSVRGMPKCNNHRVVMFGHILDQRTH